MSTHPHKPAPSPASSPGSSPVRSPGYDLDTLLPKDRVLHHSRAELEEWAARYRASAAATRADCAGLPESLLRDLFGHELLDPQAVDMLVELLEILESLSADPITMSCAILHVAGLRGRDIGPVVTAQPLAVRQQLDELRKLKLYESDGSLSTTERSAEGLRRLLLALVEDVRVVLIDLAWQLVLMRHRAFTALDRHADAFALALEMVQSWPDSGDAWQAYAGSAERSGDSFAAERGWARIAAATPEGSDRWLDATFRRVTLLTRTAGVQAAHCDLLARAGLYRERMNAALGKQLAELMRENRCDG